MENDAEVDTTLLSGDDFVSHIYGGDVDSRGQIGDVFGE